MRAVHDIQGTEYHEEITIALLYIAILASLPDLAMPGMYGWPLMAFLLSSTLQVIPAPQLGL